MTEVSYNFESIIRRTKLNDINNFLEEEICYTDEFDFPPIQIKSFKFNSNTIEFGSIKRMFEKNINFILVLIGYKQVGSKKIVIFSDCVYVSKKHLQLFRGNLTLKEVIELEEHLKTFKEGFHQEARIWAKKEKEKINQKTLFDIRFKIDSKNQRRIQCAISLKEFYSVLKKELIMINKFDVDEIDSLSRSRN